LSVKRCDCPTLPKPWDTCAFEDRPSRRASKSSHNRCGLIFALGIAKMNWHRAAVMRNLAVAPRALMQPRRRAAGPTASICLDLPRSADRMIV
jgi:hypothetical protein